MSSAIIFESPLTKPLNNPNTVAILASVGIHALVLGVAFPYLSSMSSKGPSDQTDVRLIELTPSEQSRLPNLSPPTPDLSQFSNPSLENTPLLDTPTIDPTQIPPSIDSFSSPSLPALPPLEGLQSAPSLPPLPSIPRMNIYSPPVASLPAPSQNLPDPPQMRPPEPYKDSTAFQQSPFKEENIDNIRPNFPPLQDSLNNDQIRQASIDQGWRRQQEVNGQPDIAALSEPRRIDPALEEERQRRLRAELMANAEKLRASLRPDNTNTSDEEARRNYVDWLAQEQVRRKTLKPEVISISGNYPRMASNAGLQVETTSVYGVVVDASGRVVDLKPIKSAGYPILDEQAKKDILARSFSNSTGSNQPYRITVSFKPAPNVERNLPQPENNPREAPNTRQSEPPNTPAAAPSPQPQVQPTQQPTNNQTEPPITRPADKPNNQQQEQPLVEQSPAGNNLKPEPEVEEPATKPQESQPDTPVVEQSPAPENSKPETSSEPQKPSSNPSPTVAEPPAAPASQKPNPPAGEQASPPTSRNPSNQTVEPLGNAAPKKPAAPSPEALNNSSNPPGT